MTADGDTSAPVRVLRVGGYIRKSRVTMRDARVRERAKAQGISMPLASLAIQTEDIELQVSLERDGRKRRIVGFFQDIISGAREDRTGRNELYQLTDAGELDEVWVWAFDRWSREDAMAAMASVNELWKQNVKILSAEEPWIDPYGRKEDYEERVWEAFRRANAERERLRLRSGRGLTRVKQQGMVLGHAPFGFRFVDPKDRWSGLEVDPETVQALRTVFQLRYDGKSLKAISAATGLADSTLSFILHGSTTASRDRSDQQVARLRDAVGADLFDAVQSIRRTPFPATPSRAWVLRGLCECPFCERTMFGHRYTRPRKDGTTSRPRHVYHCSERRKPHTWTSVDERIVLAHILAVLDAFVAPLDYIDRVVDALRPKERVRVLFDRRKRIGEIEAMRSRAETLYLSGKRDLTWFEDADAECDREIAALPPEIVLDEDRVRERAVAMRSLPEALRLALARPDHADGINAANALLRAAVERIRFAPADKRVIIQWQPDLAAMLAAGGAIDTRPAEPDDPGWVTASQAAQRVGWDRRRLRRALERGEVPGATQSGLGVMRRWHIPETWVEERAATRPASTGEATTAAGYLSAADALRALGWDRPRLRQLLDLGLVPGAYATGEGTQRRWFIPLDWVDARVAR